MVKIIHRLFHREVSYEVQDSIKLIISHNILMPLKSVLGNK